MSYKFELFGLFHTRDWTFGFVWTAENTEVAETKAATFHNATALNIQKLL